MMIQCDQCGARYRLAATLEPGKRVRCSRCKHIFTIPASRPTILVAKDNRDFHLSVRDLLQDQPVELLFAENGEEALEKIRRHRPALVVLDVSLPKLYGFELAEQIKADPLTRNIRVILLAAIHDKTRYKRLPESLYGADDYIEAHHVMDHLIPKMRQLLPELQEQPTGQGDAGAAPDGAAAQAVQETLSRAARLARTIISDIALYNQKTIEDGVQGDDLEERLDPEMLEGEKMIQHRFPELPLADCRELLRNALANLANKERTKPAVP